MSSSKADYLKRYASKDTAESSSSKPEKKRRKKITSTSRCRNGALTVEDVSWQALAPSSGRIDEAWERAGAEDDAPVVVTQTGITDSEQQAYTSRGTWEEVTVSPPRRSRQASPSASPPRRSRQASPSASPPRRPASGGKSDEREQSLRTEKREKGTKRLETTSSGHRAGLQSAE